MKIQVNRIPYFCPIIEDHMGEKGGRLTFAERAVGQVYNVEVLEDNDYMWIVKIPTRYEGKLGGWLKIEILKECFHLIEE